jgi:hypothetical protein
MIRLTIKGALEEAIAELRGRRIFVPSFGMVNEGTTDLHQKLTQVLVEDIYIEKVYAWFMEPQTPPYPYGTLLLFTHIEDSQR